MTMHLVSPALTTTGKKKGKSKHRTSLHAAKARANAESWQKLLEKYDVKSSSKVVVGKSKSTGKNTSKGVVTSRSDWRSRVDPARLTDHIPSVDTGVSVAVKADAKQYTGDECIGIAVMHKSCLQPVFNKKSAEDAARMRRG